ncbi:MAG: hypothetical protein DRJ05_15435 [Bacteroidetes bacterium]|nr:MAG: hypothetical protein DRJ05_15435 [Bacteroidota bacterium]
MSIILNKRVIALILFNFIIASFILGQDIFLVEKPGTVKNHKYYINDFVKVKISSPDTVFSGEITEIKDSSIVIAYANEVFIKDIVVFYRTRKGMEFLQGLFLTGGGAYLFLLTINGVISTDDGEINKVPFIVAGSLIVAGIAIIPLKTRKIKMDDQNWRVKILKF